jgi:Flp pilus assembly protein TadG
MTQMTKLLRHARDTRGQALIEFALVMPLLLLLVIGIIEFGRAWNAQQALTDAAREGARKAVIFDAGTTQQDVEDVVKDALSDARIDPSKATITTDGWNDGAGQPATITIRYPYNFAFVGKLAGWATGQSSINLGTQITMRNEGNSPPTP